MPQRVPMALMMAVCACGAYGQATPPVNPPAPAPVQSTAVPASLTPSEIYKDTQRPLDRVRASLDNWSDMELGALIVGMKEAREACAKMKPEDYSGDDLYDLAHLCAFGQDWNDANAAATRYIASHAEPHQAQAYAISVNALMHQNAVDAAVRATHEMLSSLPYDAEVAFTLRYMKDTLEQAGNADALSLAGEEHDKILAALKLGVPLKATTGSAVMSVGELYESAMELPFFYQSMGNGVSANAVAADCDSAVPDLVILPADDRTQIESVRTRFHLFGAPLPNLIITRAFLSPTARPQLPQSFGAATVLVLFPDWCAQCRSMMKTLAEFAKVNATTPVYAYGLVFEDTSMIPDKDAHAAYLKELQGTSTLEVPATTAQSFGAQEFPLAIVVGSAGTIYFIGPIPVGAFDGGGYIEKVVRRIMTSESAPKGKTTIHWVNQ